MDRNSVALKKAGVEFIAEMVGDRAFVFGGQSVRFDRNKANAKKIMINSRNELTVSACRRPRDAEGS